MIALIPTLIEVLALTLGVGLLIWASLTRQRWDTISELFWTTRDSLGPRGRVGLVLVLALGLIYLWWHLAFG